MSSLLTKSLPRRNFLGLLSGGAAALAIDPERLLWVPGKKLVSVPKRLAPQWFGVNFIPDDYRFDSFELRERYLKPSIEALGEYVKSLDIKRYRFQELPKPFGVEKAVNIKKAWSSASGVCLENVRHITAYDLHRDRLIHRLDVMVVPS